MEYVRSVHNTLNEQNVIFGVVFIVEIGQFAELGAARSHVHVRDRSLEAGALWRWFERLDNVLTVVLVYQDQGDFVVKWPLEQGIKLSLHQHEKEREMCSVPHPISIEVDSDAHFVAVLCRIKRRTVE